MRPGLREYTSLMDACKRAAQPTLAAHVMHHVLPEQGLVPDTQAWNALLGAYGRNGDMDSAYATWQVCGPAHTISNIQTCNIVLMVAEHQALALLT